jgi:hypothetical protein
MCQNVTLNTNGSILRSSIDRGISRLASELFVLIKALTGATRWLNTISY